MISFLNRLPILVRYLLAGGTSTAVDLGLLYVLTEYASWWYLASATAAFSVAVLISFTLQKFYTFRHRDASRGVVATQSALFLTLQFTNIGINTLLMYALVEWAGLHYFLAQIIAAAAIAVGSFFVYRLVIFHPSAPLTRLAENIALLAKRHRAALVVMLLVSLLYGAHHFLMPRFMPEGLVYNPVTFESDPDAGGYYGPRANAFFARNEMPLPSLLPILNPLIMGGLGKVLGSMERAFIVSDFLFPPLIFLAVYALIYEVVRRRTLSLCLTSVFMVSPLAALFSPSAPILAEAAPLYFSSFEYPKITFLFYALALFFMFRALRNGGRKNIILGGIFFGTLFYTYLYDWVYLTVALGISFVWFLMRREWSGVKACASILGLGGIISIPYWLNFAALRRLPHYEDLMFRIGGIEVGRKFRFASVWKSYARHLVWIAALTATTLKRTPRRTIFLISLLAAYFVVVNVQVVLGFSPQPDHWYRETFLPLFLALGVVGAWFWERYASLRISTRRASALAFIFIAFFFAQAFFMQYRLSSDQARDWGIPRTEASAYAWLTKNTPVGSVVGSISPETNRNLLLFTRNRAFMPSGGTTLTSNDELWARLGALGALWELSPEKVRRFTETHTYFLLQDYYRSRTHDSYFTATLPPKVPDEELANRTAAYAAVRRDGAPPPYPLDYLLVGPHETDLAPTPDSFSAFSVVYDADGIHIYAFE